MYTYLAKIVFFMRLGVESRKLFTNERRSKLKPKFHYADFVTKSATSSRQSHRLVADTDH